MSSSTAIEARTFAAAGDQRLSMMACSAPTAGSRRGSTARRSRSRAEAFTCGAEPPCVEHTRPPAIGFLRQARPVRDE